MNHETTVRPIVHVLKCVSPYYQDQWKGIKPFEVRKDDRNYAVGDFILLKEWINGGETGSTMLLRITCIVREDGLVVPLPKDLVILGTEVLARSRYQP